MLPFSSLHEWKAQNTRHEYNTKHQADGITTTTQLNIVTAN